MKVVFKIGYKDDFLHPGAIGVCIEERDEPNEKHQRIRADNLNVDFARVMKQGFAEKLVDRLAYVGYEIIWKCKMANGQGYGMARIDFKEKNNCPPDIAKFGRRLYEFLCGKGTGM